MNLYTDFWKRTMKQVISKVDPLRPSELDLDVKELQTIGESNVTGYNGGLFLWAGKIEKNYKDSAVFRSLKAYLEATSQVRTSLPGNLRIKIYANSTLKIVYSPITFDTIIQRYKEIAPDKKIRELYKWKLVKQFQDKWRAYEAGNVSFVDFFKDIDFKNLVYLNAVSTLKTMAREKPKELEEILKRLFDENVDLQTRINTYLKEYDEVFYTLDTKGYKSAQDERTIATLLTFRHPDKYTFFKDTFYSRLCKALGVKPYPTREKLVHYYTLINDFVHNHLTKYPELIAFKNSLLDDSTFNDQNNILLAQDILYLTLDSTDEAEAEAEDDSTQFTDIETEYLTKHDEIMHPLNQILFGPPGTGKTYNTINKSLEIVDQTFYNANKHDRKALTERFRDLLINDWNKTDGQIAFVTFHQNMSYEDFIEGIKPDLEQGDQDLSYTVEDGIFKKICKLSNRTISIEDNFEAVYDKLLQEIEDNNGALILHTTKKNKPFTIYENSKGNLKFHTNTEKAYEGVMRKDFIAKYLQTGEFEAWPSYIEGVGEYIKKKFGYTSAQKSETKNYVLIIDEINRGNISQIFGELITLIEDDKRQGQPEELTVTLPYSKKPFSVPANLHIIGTMNTADRSVEALDSALRRRFVFENKPSLPALLNINSTPSLNFTDIDLERLLTHINKRIEKLLSKDYQIGHAYLINVRSMEELKMVFHAKILPLLQEYFFGDQGRIGLVLGEVFIKNLLPDQPVNLMSVAGYDTGDLNTVKLYKIQNIQEWDDSTFIANLKAIYGE